MKKTWVKIVCIFLGILFCFSSINGFVSFAQDSASKEDPLITWRNQTNASIKELESRDKLSKQEADSLQYLKERKKQLDKRIAELKIEVTNPLSSSAVRQIENKLDAEAKAKTTVPSPSPDIVKAKEAEIKAKDEEVQKESLMRAEGETMAACLTCKAIAANNNNICNEIKDKEQSEVCRSDFMLLTLLGELEKSKGVSPLALELSKKFFEPGIFYTSAEDLSRKAGFICEAYLNGDAKGIAPFLKKEEKEVVSALVTGNIQNCLSLYNNQDEWDGCVNFANFSLAIKSQDKNACSRLKDPKSRVLCMVHFNKNKEVCDDFLKEELKIRGVK
ncbi:MAG: hypothetical protein PHP89_02610 [Candidatus Omnitrophica bacterium]|nr:hypothetical protein [Candidatus Omnitrophota bacterium]MDD3987819.1 hypothetical protein [Candidatus Omnitrophota bacterium]MDD5665161.1 hypothetical protein [Candidatus Omnitrophota bacterium]